MAWDTRGNVPKDAESIQSELESWENDVAPSSIEETKFVDTGSNRVTIVIRYTA